MIWFIKKFDVISPSITLHYKEESQHTSVFSGLLSMIVFALVFTAEIYYFLSFVERLHPKAYFFNRYIEDAGAFPVNASSMFHFIQVVKTETNKVDKFEFDKLRVFGFNTVYSDKYMEDPHIADSENYWIYDVCNNNTDTEGISHLINFEDFDKAICIRYYHDKNGFHETGTDGFKWPVIEKGCSNPDRTFYGIIIQRCDESHLQTPSNYPECATDPTDITAYIDDKSLKYQLLTHNADLLNYDKPYTSLFQEVTGGIKNGVYSVHNLNYNPSKMLSYNGYFFENITEENSFTYVQNDIQTIDETTLGTPGATDGCLIAIYFWMQNMLQQYERNYDRIQDILANIGGVCYVVVSVAQIINILVNKFITLIDTENYIHPDNLNQKEGVTIFKKINEIMSPPKKGSGFQNKQDNMDEDPIASNDRSSMRDLNSANQKNPKDEQVLSNALKGGKIINNLNNEGISTIKKKTINKNVTNNIIKNRVEANKNDISNFNNSPNKLYENDEKTVKETFILFFKYIWYLIKCKKDYPAFSYYEKFRARLISEENLIQSYLNIQRISTINNVDKPA